MARPEELTLGLLPERKLDWRTVITSYSLEILFIICLINISLIWPEHLQLTRKFHITELVPIPSLHSKPLKLKRAPEVRVKLLPPAPVTAPKMVVPQQVRAVQPKPREVEAPKVVVNTFSAPKLVQTAGGARMAKIIRTGEFGSSAKPTVNAPIQKVQTGGFGDPNGVKGEGKPGASLTITKVGSFDLPEGPGSGNGAGGAKGIKGTVASAGFGNGIAQPGNGDGRSNGRGSGVVQTGGFGAQEVAQGGARAVKPVDSGPPTNQVEILYKPQPVYTQEARQLKLEGEVLLEVSFRSTGQLQVNRVVRGLGHGLDEAAVAAANKIKFKPALRNGNAVDSTAVIHVVFQLAY